MCCPKLLARRATFGVLVFHRAAPLQMPSSTRCPVSTTCKKYDEVWRYLVYLKY